MTATPAIIRLIGTPPVISIAREDDALARKHIFYWGQRHSMCILLCPESIYVVVGSRVNNAKRMIAASLDLEGTFSTPQLLNIQLAGNFEVY